MNRIFQTAALIACAPFLWLFGVVMYSLVMAGQTAQQIVKVWRA